MNETNKKANNENEVNSVPYTKAGLLENAAEDTGDKSDNKIGEHEENANSVENTPKISKEESTERDRERPIH